MNALVSPVNTVTMTSLELVQFINNQRVEGVIKRAGLFSRVTSNGSVRPGWIGA
jgi:hypothetical protein